METTTRAADELTARQEWVLGIIGRLYRGQGWPPTVRQMMRETGIGSPNGIMTHLRALVRKGAVRRVVVAESVRYLPAVPEGCCPCCGRPGE